MASRQEEKEARRQARLAEEAKEAKSASAKRRLQLVFGGVLGVLILGGVVLAIATGLGGGGDGDDGSQPAQASANGVTLPAVKTSNLTEAADLAKCTVAEHPIEGRTHEDKVFTESDYKTNPPTSGNHFQTWAQDGIYTADNLPQLGEVVHTLEHGRIDVQYKPGTPQNRIDQLEAFLGETEGYHQLLFPNNTNMTPDLAATAWGWSLTCPQFNDSVWDALRAFRDAHIDQGPEKIP